MRNAKAAAQLYSDNWAIWYVSASPTLLSVRLTVVGHRSSQWLRQETHPRLLTGSDGQAMHILPPPSAQTLRHGLRFAFFAF